MTLDELHKEVRAIHRAVKKLRESGLSERALVLLIQHAAPTVSGRPGRSAAKPSAKMVRAVLDGIEHLEEFITEDEED